MSKQRGHGSTRQRMPSKEWTEHTVNTENGLILQLERLIHEQPDGDAIFISLVSVARHVRPIGTEFSTLDAAMSAIQRFSRRHQVNVRMAATREQFHEIVAALKGKEA